MENRQTGILTFMARVYARGGQLGARGSHLARDALVRQPHMSIIGECESLARAVKADNSSSKGPRFDLQ